MNGDGHEDFRPAKGDAHNDGAPKHEDNLQAFRLDLPQDSKQKASDAKTEDHAAKTGESKDAPRHDFDKSAEELALLSPERLEKNIRALLASISGKVDTLTKAGPHMEASLKDNTTLAEATSLMNKMNLALNPKDSHNA